MPTGYHIDALPTRKSRTRNRKQRSFPTPLGTSRTGKNAHKTRKSTVQSSLSGPGVQTRDRTSTSTDSTYTDTLKVKVKKKMCDMNIDEFDIFKHLILMVNNMFLLIQIVMLTVLALRCI